MSRGWHRRSVLLIYNPSRATRSVPVDEQMVIPLVDRGNRCLRISDSLGIIVLKQLVEAKQRIRAKRVREKRTRSVPDNRRAVVYRLEAQSKRVL